MCLTGSQVLDGLARYDLSGAFPEANIAAALNTDARDLTVRESKHRAKDKGPGARVGKGHSKTEGECERMRGRLERIKTSVGDRAIVCVCARARIHARVCKRKRVRRREGVGWVGEQVALTNHFDAVQRMTASNQASQYHRALSHTR